jgi:DNA-binding CsgD family transcriptional regulator
MHKPSADRVQVAVNDVRPTSELVVGALLERDRELSEVTRLLERTASGEGSVLVLEGTAGIGKTRLLAQARADATNRDMRVLSASGDRLEREFAFGVVRQLFESTFRSVDADDASAALEGAAHLAAELVGRWPFLAPDAGTSRDLEAAAAAASSVDPAFPALHGLYWLCANLATQRPLVVVIDDAQWADAVSLRFLAYLGRRICELPVLVVMAYSTSAPRDDTLLIQTASGPFAHTVTLDPLSRDGVDALVRGALAPDADDAFCAACHAATGGNPLLLHELLISLRTTRLPPTAANAVLVGDMGPANVARAVLLRLSHLGDAAQGVVRAVALLGADADMRQVATLSGLDLRAAQEATDALVAQEILTAGRPLQFVHSIVRAAIYSSLLPADLSRGHAAAARMLRSSGAPSERISVHLLAGEPGDCEWAVEMLRDAARQAVARGAPDAAATYLRRALAEPPSPDDHDAVLFELGSVELRLGIGDALERLQAVFDRTDDPHARVEAARRLAHGYLQGDRAVDAVAVLEEAIAGAPRDDRELSLELEASLVNAAVHDPSTFALARERLSNVAQHLDGDSPAERFLLANLAHVSMLTLEPATAAADLAERALGDGLLLRERTADQIAFYRTVTVLMVADRVDTARHCFDEALADAQRRGSVVGFALASLHRAFLHYRVGAIPDCEADVANSLEAQLGLDAWMGLEAALGLMVTVLVEKGDLVTAEALLERHGLDGWVPDTEQGHRYVLHSRGLLRLAQHDHDAALADFLELEHRVAAESHANRFTIPFLPRTATALAQLGKHDRARAHAERHLEFARAWGAPSVLGGALLSAGIVEGGDTGLALLRESVEVLARSPARLEQARALIELGAALRRGGQRVEARDPLRRGLDLAHRCGASALVESAQHELRVAGGRPRRFVLVGPDSLTASERRVAEMAANGLANREIAQALFVSTRTVEAHLTQAYLKLGISSRDELAAELAHPPEL